jgi:hypothetical protein
MVVGSAFADETTASAALDLLRSSGVRQQDISVIAHDRVVAERLAGDRAWTPGRRDGLLRRLLPAPLPSEVKERYRDALRSGKVVILAAADGQPPDTIAALFAQAQAERIETWWQPPADLFAPPELAGPF